MFALYIIPPYWDGTGSQHRSWWKKMSYLSSIFNAIATDDLAMQVAMASATMVLNSQNISA